MSQPTPAIEPATRADCSRRHFVATSALTVLCSAVASACGDGVFGGAPSGPILPAGAVVFESGVVTIQLTQVPTLTASSGFLLVQAVDSSNRRPNVFVIHLPDGTYRAFTSICTHQQCDVGAFSNGHIQCFCHGSEYDTTGRPVAGPAPSALRTYAVTLDTVTQVLRVTGV